jgi:hypothetical protein
MEFGAGDAHGIFEFADEQCSQCEGRPLMMSLSNAGSVKAADEYGAVRRCRSTLQGVQGLK